MKRHGPSILILAATLVALGTCTYAGGTTGFLVYVGLAAPFFEAALLSARRHG